MSRLFAAALVVLSLGALSVPTFAADYNSGVTAATPLTRHGRFGIGLGGGTLTSGVTGKLYLDDRNAIQAVVGTYGGYFANNYGFSVGADYLRVMPDIVRGTFAALNWNVGAGVSTISLSRYAYANETILGASGILGLGLELKAVPVEVVVEWRPSIFSGTYLSGVYLGETGGAVRWYF